MREKKQVNNYRMITFVFAGLAVLASGLVMAGDISKAQKLFDAQDYRAAMIELKSTLQESPKDGDARALLGRTYMMLGQAQAAEKELSRAKEVGAEPAKWAVSLAEVYVILGRQKDILQEIPLALLKAPKEKSKLMILHGLSYRHLKKTEKAKQMFEQALSLDEKNYRATLGIALLATDASDFDTAYKHIDAVLSQEPNNVNALSQKADLLSKQAKTQDSLAVMDKILELKPDTVRTRIGRAKTHIFLKDREKAAIDVDWLMAKYPNLPVVAYLKGSLLFLEGKYSEAEINIQKVLSAFPDDLPAHRLMGAIALARDNHVLAEVHLARLVAANSKDLSAVKGLVEARFNQNKLDEAVEVIEEALNSWPEDAELVSMLGSIYVRQGKVEKGKELLSKAAKLNPGAVSVRTNLALAMLGSGDKQGAIAELEKATEIESGVGKSDEILALTLAQNGQFKKGFDVVTRIIEANPTSARGYLLRGRIYLASGDNIQAQKDFQQAIKLDSGYVEAKVFSGRLYLMEGVLDKAEAMFGHVLSASPENLPAKLGMIDISRKKKDLKQYQVWLEKTYEMHPSEIQPSLLLIGEYIRQNEVVKALGVARQLQQRHPKNVQTNKAYAEVLLRNKEFRRAEEYYQKLIRLQPESPEGYLLVADTRITAGEDKKALEIVKKGILKLKNNYTLMVKKTQLLNKLGEFEKALGVAKKLQELFPKRPAGYVLEADIYSRSGKLEKAVSLYQQSLTVKDDASVRVRLHQMLRKTKGVRASIVPLEGWLKKHPDDARVATVLAMAYQEIGEAEKAVKLYQSVLKAQPQNILVLNNIAWLSYHDLGQKEQGMAYARKAHELSPGQPAILDTLGWMLLKSGKVQEGAELIKQAVKKLPNDANIRFHLAYALNVQGKKAQAKTELNSILSTDQAFSSRSEAEALLKEINGTK